MILIIYLYLDIDRYLAHILGSVSGHILPWEPILALLDSGLCVLDPVDHRRVSRSSSSSPSRTTSPNYPPGWGATPRSASPCWHWAAWWLGARLGHEASVFGSAHPLGPSPRRDGSSGVCVGVAQAPNAFPGKATRQAYQPQKRERRNRDRIDDLLPPSGTLAFCTSPAYVLNATCPWTPPTLLDCVPPQHTFVALPRRSSRQPVVSVARLDLAGTKNGQKIQNAGWNFSAINLEVKSPEMLKMSFFWLNFARASGNFIFHSHAQTHGRTHATIEPWSTTRAAGLSDDRWEALLRHSFDGYLTPARNAGV